MKKIISSIAIALACTAAYANTPQLDTLFESDWQWTLSHSPETATTLGDNRYNHKLSNTSLAAARVYNKHQQDMLKEALKIKRDSLSGQELISYDQFVLEKQQAIRAAELYPYTVQPITQIDGLQITLPSLVSQTPFNNAFDYHNYLARLHAIPAYVDGIIEQLQENMKTGWVAPKVIIAPVPGQLHDLRLHLDESEFGTPFHHIPANVPRPEVFAARGKKELSEHVAPALLKLENFLITQYLPACRDSIAASSLPAGMPYYDFMVKNGTTTDLTAQQIHDIGLTEVARIKAEMQRVMDQVGFKGSFAEFTVFLNTDPRFFYTNSDDLLNGFRDIIAHVYQVLPTMFAHLPKAQAEVKPIPLLGSEQQPAAYYNPGPDDGSRSGYFAVNVSNLNTRAKWEMETLTLHEAIPGHHLQISIAKEATDLPKFRRNGWYNAFGEGWALYSEGLGYEMGFYKDPYSKFGNLNDELFRAARLVVDTGIHALGWSREQAITYLNENTANPPNDNQVEIDRYIAWPGQALGYKIGQLKINQLRAKATTALGDKFDLRAFHNAVIDNGPIPLSVLETQIDLWISQQQAKH
ncbi:DUF885 domain-containing protein [Solimicrobium silvestre]|uniref:DUF885 domain-containing protein n=1 Tax=Solimicrobium silvestre TaxID=2099400 RepID=A0A2S9H2N1_9BURK|nr:DUF885 domain-containing protein [Solimicrobium silvestre]PRC94239.1 hypothetical protein S2091_0860 [Solimicrobium silvestre]